MGWLTDIGQKVGLLKRVEKPPAQPVMVNVSRVRRYDAAMPSNLTSDWLAWNTTANYEIYAAWRLATYRARDLERNNPHAKAFLRELCSNVLGATGIQFESKVRMQRGGELNEKVNTAAKRAWLDFRRRGNFDVTGTVSGLKFDRLVLRSIARDGEALIRIVRGYPNKYRLAFQLVEPDYLDLWHNAVLDINTGVRVTMGVEVDKWGKPLAYHCFEQSQQDLFANNSTMKHIRIPASDIIHIFLQERATQCRGMTWFAPTEIKMRMLDRYEEATAVAMRTASAKMGFLQQDKDATTYKGQGNLPSGELIEEVSPGMIVELPPGVKFEKFDPTNPSENYSDFRKSALRSIASGLGMMYNNLGNDLESTNYSSSRFGRAIEVENWRDLQRFTSEDYLQLVANVFFDQNILTGVVPELVDYTEQIKENTRWKPRGWAYVDPDKDGKAAANGIDMGLTTRRRELEEQGLDIDEVYEELAEDIKRQKKWGITFVNAYSRQPEVQSTEEDPNATGAEVVAPKNGTNGNNQPARK
jgi:lambda family phage portal protein